ncbi:MAG: dihydropteroate synthase [Oscillospiraceae bacterium]|nr:dihydropteroate synthase [Oscillospiraceae bacterium]
MKFQGKNFSFELGKRTYIMGILNVTPDSFFDGGMYNSPNLAVEHARQMLHDGADIIDIGAQSTRPGHSLLSDDEELKILKKYLPLIANETGAVISVDTFFPKVAEYALNNGASVINDVSGTFNKDMARIVRDYDCGWVVMHTGGGTADRIPTYINGVTADVADFFDTMLKKCDDFGIKRENVMLDMGIGFGKTYEDNLELIKNISVFKRDGVALLTSLSAKRVIGTATGAEGYDRVFGTIAADTVAIAGGTDMIRVHNVKESVLAAKMADILLRG